jgi:predicted TIM-barrel fold metal-dependent hydrolase
MTDMANSDRLMWANDFPHSDATWPNSQALLQKHAADLDDHTRSRILHDNCAELYKLTV